MFDGSISQQLIRRIATAIAALTGCYMFGQATGAFIEGASNVALGGPTYFRGSCSSWQFLSPRVASWPDSLSVCSLQDDRGLR